MAKQRYKGADLDKLLAALPDEIAQAVQVARNTAKASNNEDNLELIIEVAGAPDFRIALGETVLYDSRREDPFADEALEEAARAPGKRTWRERLAGGASLLRSPSVLAERLDARINRSRARLVGQLDRIPRATLSIKPLEIALLLGVLILAGSAGWMVTRDRWFETPPNAERYDMLWERWQFSSELALPSYFSVIIIIFGVLLLLNLAQWGRQTKIVEAALRDTFGKKDNSEEDEQSKPKAPENQRNLGIMLLIVSGIIVLQAAAFIRYFSVQPNLLYAGAILGIFAGWWLMEVPLERVTKKLEERGGRWMAMLLAHVALISLIGRLYTQDGFPWFNVLFLAFAATNLFTYRRQISPGFWIISLALILFSINIYGWWYAVIGDEYSFYRNAVFLNENGLKSLLEESIFRGDFTYGSHPYFSSLLQAIFIRLFGDNNFGWRFSSIYYAALSTGIFYVALKNIFRKNVALFSALLLAGSHYLMSFSKIGYNNPQALLTLAITLWATTYAVKSRYHVTYFMLGVVIGINLYVYPAALFVIPLPIFFLLLYRPPFSKEAFLKWGGLSGAFFLMLLPLLTQPTYWIAKIPGTFFNRPELVDTTTSISTHINTNLLYSVISPFFIVEESHFVSIGFMDPATASLFLIGVTLLFWRFWRKRTFAFLFVTFIYMIFALGVFHDRRFPPPTRMFLLLPWMTIFAALALAWTGKILRRFGFSKTFAKRVLLGVVLVIIGINLMQAYPVTRRRNTRYQNFEALFLKISQEAFTSDRGDDISIALLYNEENLHVPTLLELLDLYQVPYKPGSVREITNLPISDENTLSSLGAANTLVIIDPDLDEQLKTDLSLQLVGLITKIDCPVATVTGDVRFHMWYSAELSQLCSTAS